MTTRAFDTRYYRDHELDRDRLALWWYARVIRRLCPAGGRILDFGCGTGHLLKRLSGDFEAVGFDPAPVARSQCRTHAPDAVVLEEWESLPRASFDVIVSLHTMEHLAYPLPTLRRLAEKLVPEGKFFMVVPNPQGLGHRLKGKRWFGYRDRTHVSLMSRAEWVATLRKAGLQVVSVHGDGMWDAPYVALLPVALQRLLFGAPAAVQVFFPIGKPFLPPVLGECLVVTARRPGTD
ncbi:class I SAM-dependent methyltransferase [Candidatus Binatia bacterium]|nr:class I SAM-dependent methyltransferase [Candidatus Binatia bacterium]